MLAGVWQGLLSNLHAANNFGIYSSQIYILNTNRLFIFVFTNATPVLE